MIPTMILFGIVLGRWWRACLVAAAILWPSLVLVTGAIDSAGEVVAAAALGVANAAVGAVVHQAVLQVFRRVA